MESGAERDMVAVDGRGLMALGGEFRRWYRQLERLGGCVAPVLLVGHTITRHRVTGEVVHVFTSESQVGGRLMVACRNRRDAVCPACSLLHKGDTYQIVVSGLSGGKGVPRSVATHPRLFATLTAPSFGPVHRIVREHDRSGGCRVRAGQPVCSHGNPLYCDRRHGPGDRLVGTPLCSGCYDFTGLVLWNASVGKLWNRFTDQVRREVAMRYGVSRTRLGGLVRVSFVKVTEYQRRGAVHVHAVVRFDGPDGPAADPPAWADGELLSAAVQAAGRAVSVHVPNPNGGELVMRWGREFDVQAITAGSEPGAGISARSAAGYVAKYVTKGDIPWLILPRRIRAAEQIEYAPVSEYARELMRRVWWLGGLAEYEALNLRPWTHQLGFRGNIATKSRVYSVTYGQLRGERAAFQRAASGLVLPDPETTVTESRWRFIGQGLTPQEAEIAAGLAETTALKRGPRPDWIEWPQDND